MTPVVRVTFGDEHFDAVKLMASEVLKIKAWAGYGSKKEWLAAFQAEEIDAFRCAYALMAQRRGDDVTFDQVDFDTDDMRALLVDPTNGREVMPVVKVDKDGQPVLRSGAPQIDRDKAGRERWTYVDDGSDVPPPPPQQAPTSS